MTEQEPIEMTFGETLVGLSFNPSKMDEVTEAKLMCADLADLLYDHHEDKEDCTDIAHMIYDQAIGSILTAQMLSVKYLTFKN